MLTRSATICWNRSAVGVDIDDTMLAVARERWPASPFQFADG
jgi:ubiquinone/menaquinone biosynthesis C-methylase UbiE